MCIRDRYIYILELHSIGYAIGLIAVEVEDLLLAEVVQ